MRYLRSIAAIAAIVTAALVQATLIAPIAGSVPISLCAVLVAAVGLADGVTAAMAFGFTAGLIVDLASSHPAGVLALVWTCLGVVCGMASTGRSLREDVLTAATACAIAGAAGTALLAVVHASGATWWSVVRGFIPSWFGFAVLACAVIPIVRASLRNGALRAHHPVVNEVRVVQRG